MTESMQIVTIDGPSGVGKSTVSRSVASLLGYTYLDTGAMYRGVALLLQREGVDLVDERNVALLIKRTNITLKPPLSKEEDVRVFINGENVSSLIRTPEMSMIASKVSALSVVRQHLTELQRKIGNQGKVVVEGRDMGTVVFPGAAHKFFLDAQAKERCRRRVKQLQKKGIEVDEEEILQMILKRDKNDRERQIAPLKKADDAILVDTTHMSAEDVCTKILGCVKQPT